MPACFPTPSPKRLARRIVTWIAALVCVLGAATSCAFARVIEVNPDNYRDALTALKPGDTLQLTPGEYRRGLPVHRLEGTRDAPIVIRGPHTGDPARFVARAGSNTVSIVDSAHVHIRDLTLDGGNVPVDAVKAEGHSRWAHHITLENLTIVNHGLHQQNVAISTKCPAWGWVIRGNRIHGAGTGMYLGNSDGTRAFYGAVIEYNVVTQSVGYAIQIKHQHAREALEIAPKQRLVTIIRHNVLSKEVGGSAGPDARPNLLLGHWPRTGLGSTDEYLVYGNYFADNPNEALVQAEGNVALYNNVLRNRTGPGIHIQPHNDVPRDVRILHNTIVTQGSPIVVRTNEATDPNLQRVQSNLVFSSQPPQGGVQRDNLVYSLDDADSMLGSGIASEPFDPFPRDEQMQCARPGAPLFRGLAESSCDFNGAPRRGDACGAYAGYGRNPGWLPTLAPKPRTLCRTDKGSPRGRPAGQ